ncbi:MAG: putative esterase [Candidatus Omnitrophota bacterium]
MSERLAKPAYESLGKGQQLVAFEVGALPDWEKERIVLRERWLRLLGTPSFNEDDKKAPEIVERFDQPDFRGTLLRQSTGPDTRQLVLLMEPKSAAAGLRPGAWVPFYHPDDMAGFDLKRRTRITRNVTTQFGRHLVQQGYVVVCTEAFPYNIAPGSVEQPGLGQWGVAAKKLLQTHPNWTGMGKLVHDSRRAIDLLLEQPNIDRDRIVAIGHSLGGKMAFYTACLDSRIKATIANDFGIGWDFTNWKDPWYLGDQILADDFPLAHHQLLALHAPRSFLLIAGQTDKPESWQYVHAVKPVYALYGRPHALGMYDHAAGHSPTEEAMRLAYAWLAEQLDWQPSAWSF